MAADSTLGDAMQAKANQVAPMDEKPPKSGPVEGEAAAEPLEPAPRRGCGPLLIFAVLAMAVVVYLSAFSLAWVLFFSVPVFVPVSTNSNASAEAARPGELARFPPACISKACPVLGEGFFFGLATAPAHVEDQLEDGWLDFAELGHMRYNRTDTNTTYWASTGVNGTTVKAWQSEAVPDQRLRFWSQPEVEMELAKGAGIDAFRMGVDWGRLVPVEPNGTVMTVDWAAVEQYRSMMRLAKEKYGLRVMLTLFHHSFPKWGMPWGGWTVPDKAIPYFVQLAELAVTEFGPWVDYWATFNEPSIFALLTYCVGVWPPGFPANPLHTAPCFTPIGPYSQAMTAIAQAHNQAYAVIRAKSAAPIGVAHNTAFMVPYSAMDLAAHQYFNQMTLFPWVDQIVGHLDFCGLNYYSQEFLSSAGLQASPSEEFSENGRAVYPDGLLRILTAFHDRYKERYPGLRYIITENGIADRTDVIRGPYLVEHLLAVSAAREQGVPVDGYFQWTLSDNWEWADGYCPKFGLVDVDRANNLTRIPRPSYYLFKKIVEGRVITEELRDTQWNALQEAAKAGKKRAFCRTVDSLGRMGSDTLDAPMDRDYSLRDWRFGHYKQPTLFAMYQRTGHVFNCWSRDLMAIVTGTSP